MVQRIKKLYMDLELHKLYETYENETYNRIQDQIQRICTDVPHIIFTQILDRIYKRNR